MPGYAGDMRLMWHTQPKTELVCKLPDAAHIKYNAVFAIHSVLCGVATHKLRACVMRCGTSKCAVMWCTMVVSAWTLSGSASRANCLRRLRRQYVSPLRYAAIVAHRFDNDDSTFAPQCQQSGCCRLPSGWFRDQFNRRKLHRWCVPMMAVTKSSANVTGHTSRWCMQMIIVYGIMCGNEVYGMCTLARCRAVATPDCYDGCRSQMRCECRKTISVVAVGAHSLCWFVRRELCVLSIAVFFVCGTCELYAGLKSTNPAHCWDAKKIASGNFVHDVFLVHAHQ